MSRSLRAQVSLIFSDEDLFDNFVIPLKENKELSGMITKLLSVYYTNERVRDLIEGISLDDVVEGAEDIIDSTEAINNMRQTLAMQDFLFEQAKQTLEAGSSEVDALMKATNIAKQSGVVETETSDVGEVLSKVNLEDSTSASRKQESIQTGDGSALESRVNMIEETLNKIMSMLENNVASQTSSVITEPEVKVETQEEVKTESLVKDTQVPLSEISSEPVLETPTQSSLVITSEQESTVQDEVNNVVKEEDASSELSDVLADLLG